jgi:hypothetical protein
MAWHARDPRASGARPSAPFAERIVCGDETDTIAHIPTRFSTERPCKILKVILKISALKIQGLT